MINDIGTDIVNIEKLDNIIKSKPSFVKKVYTKNEINLAKNSKNPTFFYATRFAAKEAIFKAFDKDIEFNDIEILKNADGKPCPKILSHPEINIKLSLSYDAGYAIAFCIILS